MDLVEHLKRQIAFSRGTFGPGARTEGVIDHIRKELIEVEKSNGSPEEWVDVVILALDGLTRAIKAQFGPDWEKMMLYRIHDEVAIEACALIREKQNKNEARDWPDWRTADPSKAIEHVRPKSPPPGRKG